MKTSTNAKTGDANLAQKWAAGLRTIRRWRKDGAPLGDDSAMRTWLSTRKHLPPGTAALLEATRTTERAAVAVAEPNQPQGAASTLKRMEQAEAAAYAAFKMACESGDEVAIKASRENWLRISESLRRFDLAIEQARRESGDLVPREELERLAHELQQAQWFALAALETTCPSLTDLKTPGEVWTVLSTLQEAVRASVIAYLRRQRPAPIAPWLLKAVTLGHFALKQQEEDIERFTAVMNDALKQVAIAARSKLDQETAAFAAQKLSAAAASA